MSTSGCRKSGAWGWHHLTAARDAGIHRPGRRGRITRDRYRECRELLFQPVWTADLQGTAWQAVGYKFPEVGIHRGRPHLILFRAARAKLSAAGISTDHTCVRVDQDEEGATVAFAQITTGRPLSARVDAVIACDGINSAIRKQGDDVAFAGINSWRGVTRRKPILTGRSYIRVGSILTGKLVIYPIIDRVDDLGDQLINWMAEIK
jgi:hypothetical protein